VVVKALACDQKQTREAVSGCEEDRGWLKRRAEK